MKILLAVTAAFALLLTPNALAGDCGSCTGKKGDKKADPKETMTQSIKL